MKAFVFCMINHTLQMQAEMQRLREKLAISERTAKAEAQLKVNI
jgi:hypothetical protein